jgi:cell division protein FtsW (lipid II flippase)
MQNDQLNIFLYNWWRSIDRNIFITTIILIVIGCLISFIATPSIAIKYDLEPYYFVKKHLFFTPFTLFFIFFISLFSRLGIKRFFYLYFSFLFFLFYTLFFLLGLKSKAQLGGCIFLDIVSNHQNS